MDKIISLFVDWIKSAPKWVRAIVPILIAVVAILYLCTSCGVVNRVQLDKRTTRHTRDTTHIVVSQTVERSRKTFRVVSYSLRSLQSETANLGGSQIPIWSVSDATGSAPQYCGDSAIP